MMKEVSYGACDKLALNNWKLDRHFFTGGNRPHGFRGLLPGSWEAWLAPARYDQDRFPPASKLTGV